METNDRTVVVYFGAFIWLIDSFRTRVQQYLNVPVELGFRVIISFRNEINRYILIPEIM